MKKILIGLILVVILFSACSLLEFPEDGTGEAVRAKWWQPGSSCRWTDDFMCGIQEGKRASSNEVVMRKMVCSGESVWKEVRTCMIGDRCVEVNGKFGCGTEFSSMPSNCLFFIFLFLLFFMKRFVVVKTGCKKSKVVDSSELKVYLKSRPVEGKANIELVKFLSRHFKCKVRIVSGFRSKKKLISLE